MLLLFYQADLMGNTVGDPSLTKLHILTFIQPVIISIVSPSRLYFLSLSGSLFLLLPCCLTLVVVANEWSASLIFQNFAYWSQIDLFKGITNHVTIILKSLSHNSSLHYIWRLNSSESCPCSWSSVQVEGGSSALWFCHMEHIVTCK